MRRWLLSSRSLLEQGVREGDLLQLRFKYYSFYELDEVRAPTARALLYPSLNARRCSFSSRLHGASLVVQRSPIIAEALNERSRAPEPEAAPLRPLHSLATRLRISN